MKLKVIISLSSWLQRLFCLQGNHELYKTYALCGGWCSRICAFVTDLRGGNRNDQKNIQLNICCCQLRPKAGLIFSSQRVAISETVTSFTSICSGHAKQTTFVLKKFALKTAALVIQIPCLCWSIIEKQNSCDKNYVILHFKFIYTKHIN